MNDLNQIQIDEFTSPIAITAPPETPLIKIRDLMNRNQVRHVIIGVDNEVEGILSDRDIAFLKYLKRGDLLAKDVMVKTPYIVSPAASLESVAFAMSSRKIGSAIVQSKEENFLGIFTSTDALNALIELSRGDSH